MTLDDLSLLLARYLAAGNLDTHEALPVLRELLGEPGQNLAMPELLDALSESTLPAAQNLRRNLLQKQLQKARLLHDQRKSGKTIYRASWPDLVHLPETPLGWSAARDLTKIAHQPIRLAVHQRFLTNQPHELPHITSIVTAKLSEARAAFRQQPRRWNFLLLAAAELPPAIQESVAAARAQMATRLDALLAELPKVIPAGLDDDVFAAKIKDAFAAAGEDRQRQQALLDLALAWPTASIAAIVPDLCRAEWAQERAGVVLMMRFGRPQFTTWADWRVWLTAQAKQWDEYTAPFRSFAQEFQTELLPLWYAEQETQEATVLAQLHENAKKIPSRLTPEVVTSQ